MVRGCNKDIREMIRRIKKCASEFGTITPFAIMTTIL